ncbi:cysteine desulfurase family protein [Thermanaerothrix sp. 4228-RoL]|uniref:cysteine desulfurase n=1 Tax=Thermanaerothrix solaris TaxID=3058434 RepID=A0ABU3NN56_9CHLR|nr:cysteine desulfurase family protein [Thermanaerothrix sp. 4228-RoL]MDT8898276.1 cysteine desulfurase family protein [Thermanaerothrix sp. 4228-RoL]
MKPVKQPIYLDYNATTPCDPRVVQAMLPYFTEIYGNPANGLHVLGRKAALAVETARERVANLINAQPSEIFFTSGATESNHLAILGTAEYAPVTRRKILTCAIEHKAVLAPCKRLAERGFEVVILPVDENGIVRFSDLEKALDENTFLVSIQSANNEIGTLQPISKIASIAHHYGALVHTDAAQAAGKIPVDVNEWEVDLLSLSAHKMYGPKGIGALYVRGGKRKIPIRPMLEGGGQESGLRAGTLNVPGIVGFGAACEIAIAEMPKESARMQSLRDELEKDLLKNIPNLRINARAAPRLPNTSSLTFEGEEADALLARLPQLMMSTGSACNTGALEPSHVLLAIGLTRQQASSSIRISIGRMTTENDIQVITEQILFTILKTT